MREVGGHDEAAAFRARLIEGAVRLTTQSVLVCLPFLYAPDRLDHLWRTLRAISATICRHMEIVVLTDAVADAQLQVLAELVAPLSDAITVRVEADLADPRHLPWRHKTLIADVFLDAGRALDLFVYLEDDIVVTPANLAYFVGCRDQLCDSFLIPSFLRCEYNRELHALHAVDWVWPQALTPDRVVVCGGTAFVIPTFPFCAMYILDQELAREHVGSASFDIARSGALGGWGLMERASLGQVFERLPPGRTTRYALPFDRATSRLLPACLVHHAPDKYTNLVGEHGRVAVRDALLK